MYEEIGRVGRGCNDEFPWNSSFSELAWRGVSGWMLLPWRLLAGCRQPDRDDGRERGGHVRLRPARPRPSAPVCTHPRLLDRQPPRAGPTIQAGIILYTTLFHHHNMAA